MCAQDDSPLGSESVEGRVIQSGDAPLRTPSILKLAVLKALSSGATQLLLPLRIGGQDGAVGGT